MKYKPSKKIKKIKKQGSQEINGLIVLGVVLMLIMAVVAILDSKEIIHHKPITAAGYWVSQDIMMTCWMFTGIAIISALKMASLANKLDVQRHKESLEEIQALESRIDYLQDKIQVAIANDNNLQDWIRDHDDDLKKQKSRIDYIEEYLSENCVDYLTEDQSHDINADREEEIKRGIDYLEDSLDEIRKGAET